MAQGPMRAVFFTYVWPEPWSSAAGVRTRALMDAMMGAGWKLTALSPCSPNRARSELEALGIACHEVAANDSGLQNLLQELGPKLVIFDRFVLEEQFGFHVRAAVPGAARVVDTQDLHFLRHSRELALKNKLPLAEISAAKIPWDERSLLRECASILRSDLTFVLSDFEEQLLKQHLQLPAELVELASFSFSRTLPAEPDFSERRHFVFLGNFRHPPNHDAALWLARELWPEIRKRVPQAELHLYGSYPPKEIMQLDNPAKGIRSFGPADEAQSTLAGYRINLAPLRFGAGVKGKIADAWAAGTPTLTTPIGAEGMGNADNWGGWIAQDAEEFIRLAVEAYSAEDDWNRAVRTGAQILDRNFNPETNARAFVQSLESLLQTLEERRTRNLLGRILWREESRSTEFFSRWIEEKNKRGTAPPQIGEKAAPHQEETAVRQLF